MPKKRIPGHLSRRRRRRDAGPNLPRETYLEGTPAPEPVEQPPAFASRPEGTRPAAAARPLRPTLRRGIAGSPGRVAPPPPVEVDYSYVLDDLRQIAILAVAGFAVLIGLSFVVR
jgi:hypothetical protein